MHREKKTDSLKIPDLCPVLLIRMKKDGGNYHCKTCQNEVIDFRDKSSDEINKLLKPNTCGIFYDEQLPGQERLKLGKRVLFYCLMALSFLGFNVNPVSGQTEKKTDSIEIKKEIPKEDCEVKCEGKVKDSKEKKVHKKKRFFRGKKREKSVRRGRISAF